MFLVLAPLETNSEELGPRYEENIKGSSGAVEPWVR